MSVRELAQENMVTMKDLEKLGYCGIYCGSCKNFKENANCMGCRDEMEMLGDCPARACVITKGLLFCGECDEFPCPEVDEFYKDGNPFHNLAFRNALRIREIGAEEWLQEQLAAHTCSCGK